MHGRCYAGHATTPQYIQYDQIIQMLEVLYYGNEQKQNLFFQYVGANKTAKEIA